MILLMILGLALWVGAHFFKRLLPDQRVALGTPGKGIMAAAIVVSLILMIVGYRGADYIAIWQPPAFFTHINNLLMLFALWVYGSSAAKGAKAWPAYKTRHPQLLGVKIWAAAHLLVNGDLASILLFGGLLAWAVGSVVLINRSEPAWIAPAAAGRPTYIRLAVISLVFFILIAAIHIWLGVTPFTA